MGRAAQGRPAVPDSDFAETLDLLPNGGDHGSLLVTVTGSDRHGVYGPYGSTCVDGTVNAYLRTGRLPAADVTCAGGPTGAAGEPRARS
ncbi:alpha/beta hydrolase [Streptomyces sp. NPDC060002]|uniref:alpha/beta hydrolase n=1 Tax=Streptomyces sp. NPDC060002 TaxID=3347033 RepID=UPI0036C788A2